MKWITLILLLGLAVGGCSEKGNDADQLAALETELTRLRKNLNLTREKLGEQEDNLSHAAAETVTESEAAANASSFVAVFETCRVLQSDFLATLEASGDLEAVKSIATSESVDTVRISSVPGEGRGGGPFLDGSGAAQGDLELTEAHQLPTEYRIEKVATGEQISHVIVPAALEEEKLGVRISCRIVVSTEDRIVVDVDYRRTTRLPPRNYPLPHLESASVPLLQLPVEQKAVISTRLNVPFDESIFLGTAHIAPPADGLPPDPNREILAVFCRISKAP